MDSPNPADSNLRLANIPFQDPEGAKLHFVRVANQLSPGLASALPSLLAESPDPDSAVLLLDRLVNEHPEVLTLLNAHNFLAHYTLVVFGHSRFLGETLIQNPDLLQSFLREKNLDRSFSREEFHESLARFRSRSFETDVSLLLARFKRREYVRIMLRDVLKIAPLAETTAEISALADVLIEDALREADSRLQRRYGTPQHLDSEGRLVDTPFAVLSLGKLGGEFIRAVQPHVYTEQVNFAAIKTALVAREKMHKRRQHGAALEQSNRSINVKIDSGGIRDIEFLVQCLQRVYGGAEPWLRSGGTLFSLQKLHDKLHISGKEFHDLTSAYEFLRHVEHRLQLQQIGRAHV